MDLHKEIHFEAEICEDMAAAGWLYTPPQGHTISPDAAVYRSEYGLFPDDLKAWLTQTQPKAWEKLVQDHGANALTELMERLRKTLDRSGTLHVLRHGLEMPGFRSSVSLAQFKPASAMNPELTTRYQANRLRVIRQVHYSPQHRDLSLDLVLFLNGIPVATAELKSDFTQDMEMAEMQYRKSRDPDDGPLLSFPGGALVHFAVSNSLVQMTARLEKKETCFLPFNLGRDGDAGNPDNPNGFPTDYLLKQVWAPESWLQILGSYLVEERDPDKKLKRVVFPRYHQLDATRKIREAVLREGPGGKYLIQHSAGSGKTHSIAWTAHQLAELHDENDRKVFDSVIVVSDRTVLDEQLQEALIAHARVPGVVATIKRENQAKSRELAEALAQKKAIIACTLQTFPFTMEHIRKEAAAQGKRFAVIADEAHSSQTDETAARLKLVLSDSKVLDCSEEKEVSAEDVLADEMERRADSHHISYVAFTATPKNRTLQLFGTLPHPERKPNPEDNKPEPFHVYSMQQAIHEKFILDVLANYTPYELAFQLAHKDSGKESQLVNTAKAGQSIMAWVRLHDHHVSSHIQAVVEHFREFVGPKLGGKAKAMVVTGSRLEAVRWHLATQKYVKSKGYQIAPLVAFSGEVIDEETSDTPMSETSPLLNPGLKGRSIRKAFSSPENEYQILIVADKFQTGFDEPLLCAMYVHKPLTGVKAVQTLSRLNRVYPGKDTTYVLDFVNDPQGILEAFKIYYKEAELKALGNPEVVYDLRATLDASGFYTNEDVEAVVDFLLGGRKEKKASELDQLIRQVAGPLLERFTQASRTLAQYVCNDMENHPVAQQAKEEIARLEAFKKDLGIYVDQYTFFSQIFDYGDTGIAKRAVFYKPLYKLLNFSRPTEEIDLSGLVMADYRLDRLETEPLILTDGQALDPEDQNPAGMAKGQKQETLDSVVEKINQTYWKSESDDRRTQFITIFLIGFLLSQPVLVEQAQINSPEQFANSADLDVLLTKAIMAGAGSDDYKDLAAPLLRSPEAKAELKKQLLVDFDLYQKLRRQGSYTFA